MKNFIHILIAFALLSAARLAAQPICTISHYGEDNGLSQWRISQMLQDSDGFMWFATWNGLNRFDGYEFVVFKSRLGDGELMPSDRLRDIRLSAEGDIYVLADQDWFRFCADGTFLKADSAHAAFFGKGIKGRQSYGCNNRAFDYTDRYGVVWHISASGQLSYTGAYGAPVPVPVEVPLKAQFYMPDSQGNLWLLGSEGVFRLSFAKRPSERIAGAPKAQGSSACIDAQGRLWLSTRAQMSALMLFDAQSRPMGYLTPDGTLQTEPAEFGSPIYCMRQLSDGSMWLGSKPDGIFRLRPVADGQWTVEHFRNLPCANVYDIAEDHQGRVWIATMGGGILLCADKDAAEPHFTELSKMEGYPRTKDQNVRRLHITPDSILIAATTEGVMVGRVPCGTPANISLRLHQREARRQNSLSCNATMDILQTPDNRIFISTESGGINQTHGGASLLESEISFRHYDTATGLNSDVTMALAYNDSSLWIVGSNQLMRINLADETFDYLNSNFFHEAYRFSECRPLHLPDGRWVIGTSDGFVTLADVSAHKSQYVPPIVVTGIDKQGKGIEHMVNSQTAITLQPNERSLILHFAAIDTDDPTDICYAFKMQDDDEWNYIGRNRSVSFAGMHPGTYHLQLRSTNAGGVWVDNIRTIQIVVEPRFFEAWYGILLIAVGIAALIAAAIGTLIYIRRIKREQHETLQAYLALLDNGAAAAATDNSTFPDISSPVANTPEAPLMASLSPDDEAFMQRIMSFVESHIGNSEVNINDMASAAAVSRSGLNRKMKSIVGLTPADFMREARIKRACQLLKDTNLSVSEIAYSCGFTDPKYFTKCFRISVGKAPSECR